MIRKFRAVIDAQVRDVESSLGAGKAASWEDYRRQVGVIQGLQRAKVALDEVARKYLDEDEVLDEQ